MLSLQTNLWKAQQLMSHYSMVKVLRRNQNTIGGKCFSRSRFCYPSFRPKEYVIGEAQFDQMKDGAAIVNAARGGVIDEVALLRARQWELAFAGLDTFEEEPKPVYKYLCTQKFL